jgi:integrase
MARTVRSAKLENRAARLELKRLSGERPHFEDVHKGLAIGYRPGSAAWIIRVHISGTTYRHKKVGKADDFEDANGRDILSFKQVAKLAHTTRDELLAAAVKEQAKAEAAPEPEKPYTVREAIDAYIRFLRAKRRTADDARQRADALILPVFGDIALHDLKRERLRRWLDAVAAAPPRLRTRKGQAQRYRVTDPGDEEAKRRRQSSANRTWTILKAALNMAWRDGKGGRSLTDVEWRTVESFTDVDAARPRWLTNDEARRLINAAEGEFRTLVRAALHSGARYGALCGLNVADFEAHLVRQPDDGKEIEEGTLHLVSYKGRGGKVKAVNIKLTDEAIAFFKSITAGRAGTEIMLPRPDGERWRKSQQKRPIEEACKNAKIDPPAGFHVTRHTWASQAVMGGMPLLVVAQNLGHADTRMVEKHYGHLAPSYRNEQVRKYGPRFGAMPEDETMPMQNRA